MGKFADQLGSLFERLEPQIGRLADRFGKLFERIAGWMDKNADTIDFWSEKLIWLFGKVFVDNFENMVWVIKPVTFALGQLRDAWPQIEAAAKAAFDFISKVIADNKAAWAIFSASLSTEAAAHWAKIQEIWGAISTWFDENVIKKIAALWDWLIGNSYLVDGAARGWEAIKEIWSKMASWFDDNVIKPISALWDWLWAKILPMWQGLNKAAATAQLPTAYSGGARQAGDYVPEWQGGAGGGGGGGEPTGTMGPSTPNADIAKERERVMAQLQEPGMRELTAAVLAREMGGAEERADVLESLVNRAVVTGKHPRALMGGGSRSFYGPVRRGEVDALLRKGMSENALKEYDKAAAAVAAGRNRILGRTDQGMINEVKPGGRIGVAGEYYGFMGLKGEKESAAYKQATKMIKGPAEANTIPGGVRDAQGKGITPATPSNYTPIQPAGASLRQMLQPINMRGRTEGASSTNIAAISPVLNFNGGTGEPSAIGAQVVSAMQSSTKAMLAQLKAARAEEARLGYV